VIGKKHRQWSGGSTTTSRQAKQRTPICTQTHLLASCGCFVAPLVKVTCSVHSWAVLACTSSAGAALLCSCRHHHAQAPAHQDTKRSPCVASLVWFPVPVKLCICNNCLRVGASASACHFCMTPDPHQKYTAGHRSWRRYCTMLWQVLTSCTFLLVCCRAWNSNKMMLPCFKSPCRVVRGCLACVHAGTHKIAHWTNTDVVIHSCHACGTLTCTIIAFVGP
jgi:hypothetical protein